MSADPAHALQLAIRAALMADAGVIAAFGGDEPRVYDMVPVDPSGRITGAFPYITLGDGDQVIGDANSCADLSEVYMQLNVWSRETDGAEVRTIAAAVRKVLDADIKPVGHTVITHRFMDGLYRREPDGLTRRAIQTFRFHTQPWA